MQVADEQIAAYDSTILSLARLHVGRAGAELDDLIQEGRIAVWLTLARGIFPSKDLIQNRMRDYCRFLHRLNRLECADYGAYLPFEAPEAG